MDNKMVMYIKYLNVSEIVSLIFNLVSIKNIRVYVSIVFYGI